MCLTDISSGDLPSGGSFCVKGVEEKMYSFSEAGRVLAKRAIDREEGGLQGMAKRSKVNHVRLRRAVMFGGRLSKEEMEYLSAAIGWPMKYIVI